MSSHHTTRDTSYRNGTSDRSALRPRDRYDLKHDGRHDSECSNNNNHHNNHDHFYHRPTFNDDRDRYDKDYKFCNDHEHDHLDYNRSYKNDHHRCDEREYKNRDRDRDYDKSFDKISNSRHNNIKDGYYSYQGYSYQDQDDTERFTSSRYHDDRDNHSSTSHQRTPLSKATKFPSIQLSTTNRRPLYMTKDSLLVSNLNPDSVPVRLIEKITYNHRFRPNRVRNKSNWDVVGTEEECNHAIEYVTAFSHFLPTSVHHENRSTDGTNSYTNHNQDNFLHPKSDHDEMALSLLPSEFGAFTAATTGARPVINNIGRDIIDDNDDILNSLLPNFDKPIHINNNNPPTLSHTPSNTHPSRRQAHFNSDNLPSYTSNTASTSSTVRVGPNGPQGLIYLGHCDNFDYGYVPSQYPGGCDLWWNNRIYRPIVYVTGYPLILQQKAPEVIKEVLANVIFDNLLKLENRTPPQSLQPYTRDSCITDIVVNTPQFAFVYFAHFEDALAALSLHNLTINCHHPSTGPLQFSIVVRQSKNLNDFYNINPPPRFVHPDRITSIPSTMTPTAARSGTEVFSNAAPHGNATHLVKSSVTGEMLTPTEISENKIYLGNIAPTFSENDVLALVSSPELIHFHMVTTTNTHNNNTRTDNSSNNNTKSFAFASYRTRTEADRMIETLNRQYICGRTLIVKYALPSGPNASQQYQQSQGNDYDSSFDTTNNHNNPGDPTYPLHHSNLVPPPPPPPHSLQKQYKTLPLFDISDLPTEYIVFYNIASHEEFCNSDDREDILLDIHDVCSQFTKTPSLKYYLSSSPNSSFPDGDVCIFVMCQDAIKASQIVNRFHGKQFGPKLVAQVKFVTALTWEGNSIDQGASLIKWSAPRDD